MITGKSLLEIACHCCNVDKTVIAGRGTFSFSVIPVTAGQGIISDFSAIVCSILQFSGFKAEVTEKSDAAGLVEAFGGGADGIMMADDYQFVGVNLYTRSVADNSRVTGSVFSAALDLMAGGVQEKEVLVLGCGAVGEAAADNLLGFGARVVLHDINIAAAEEVKEKLVGKGVVSIADSIRNPAVKYRYILEATPVKNSIPDELLSVDSCIAAPGVPLGISARGCEILNNRFIHDKLELGVTAMAVSLLSTI